MARTALFARMTTLLLALLCLMGCGGAQTEEEFESWRQQVLSAPLGFHVGITAVAGTEQTAYEADVQYQKGETVLSLTAPALIAGVTLRCSGGEDTLEYDGLILALFGAREDAADPCAAVPLMLRALEEGRVNRFWRESGCLVVELLLHEGQSVRLYLEETGMTPVYGEVTENGVTTVFCHIENWMMGDS